MDCVAVLNMFSSLGCFSYPLIEVPPNGGRVYELPRCTQRHMASSFDVLLPASA